MKTHWMEYVESICMLPLSSLQLRPAINSLSATALKLHSEDLSKSRKTITVGSVFHATANNLGSISLFHQTSFLPLKFKPKLLKASDKLKRQDRFINHTSEQNFEQKKQ